MLPQDSGLPEPTRNVPPGWRPSAAVPPPALASGPDALTLLKALKRRWGVALLLGLVVAVGVGAGAWFLLAPKYTVFGQLYVSSRIKNPLVQGHFDRNEFPAFARAQAERLRGRYVINAALRQEEVKRLPMISQLPEPIPWVEQEMKVEYKENSEFITVSMRGEDQAALVTFVNALMQAYWQDYLKAEKKQFGESVAALDARLNTARERVRGKHDEINRQTNQLNPMDTPTSVKVMYGLIVNEFADKKRKLEEVQTAILQRQAHVETLKKREAAAAQMPVPDIELNRAVEEDPKVRQLQADLSRVEQHLQSYLATGASVREARGFLLERQVQAAQKALDGRRAELGPKLVELIRLREATALQGQIQQLQAEIESYARQEAPMRAAVAALETKVAASEQEAERVVRSNGNILLLQAEIVNDNDLVKQLTSQHERAKLDLESVDVNPRVTIYQEAAVQYKDNKRQILAAVAAGLAAMLGIAFCVAWWEYRARRIQTPEEVVTGLGMRVMGSVPLLPQFAVLSGDAELDAQGQTLQEAIDGIRTMLLRDAHMEGTRVVMVTSAVDGEGKTMLASHLAQSLARAGRRTLLVDCDLRRPAAHQLFEQTLQPGFSEVLLREVDESDAIRPTTAAEGLFLFPAGQYDREVIQALAKDGLERIFERLRDEYDFVVVDSHPVLAATDALLIGQYVDAVILSVLRDVSQVPRVHAAHQKLSNLGIRVLGSVVTGMPEEEMYGGLQYPATRAA